MRRTQPASPGCRQGGITLLETLVSLTLGLAVVSAAFNLYTSNRTVFKQVEGMARLQESARVAAAVLAADIRQAGGSLCRNGLPTNNQLLSGDWWLQPAYGIEGFASTATDGRANASTFPRMAGDSFTVWSGNADVAASVASASARSFYLLGGDPRGSLTLELNGNPALVNTDVVVICDFHFAAIAQYANVGSLRIVTRTNDSPDPGNCGPFFKASGTKATPLPGCSGSQAAYRASMPDSIDKDYTWTTGSMVGRLTSHHWYIGQKTATSAGSLNNLALRRLTYGYSYLPGTSERFGVTGPISDEMVQDVSNMDITYLVGDASGYPASTSYVAANQVADWTKVIAVRILLTVTSPEAIAVGPSGAASAATYTIPINVAIRSRLPGRLASQ